jgi:hypothetical protein
MLIHFYIKVNLFPENVLLLDSGLSLIISVNICGISNSFQWARSFFLGTPACGEHGSNSNYSTAVEPDRVLTDHWVQFLNLGEEGAPTLCKIDLKDM